LGPIYDIITCSKKLPKTRLDFAFGVRNLCTNRVIASGSFDIVNTDKLLRNVYLKLPYPLTKFCALKPGSVTFVEGKKKCFMALAAFA